LAKAVLSKLNIVFIVFTWEERITIWFDFCWCFIIRMDSFTKS